MVKCMFGQMKLIYSFVNFDYIRGFTECTAYFWMGLEHGRPDKTGHN